LQGVIVVIAVIVSAAGQNAFSYRKVPLPVYSPAFDQITKAILPEPTSVPLYSYDYAVNDPYSGDTKTQQESRDGDVVRGSYSLVDADGTRRVVEYYADALHGFNAVVRKEASTNDVSSL
jgi:hypothetical protein